MRIVCLTEETVGMLYLWRASDEGAPPRSRGGRLQMGMAEIKSESVADFVRNTHSPLLYVGYTRCLRGDRLADEAGKQDDGQQIGRCLDKLHRYLANPRHANTLQADGDRVEQAEHQASTQDRIGPPFAEDQCRQGNIP